MSEGMYSTVRIALDPTPAQERKMRSHCGASRFAYNVMLSRVIANRDQRGAERTYGIAEKDLTPAMNWSPISLVNDWNAGKREIAPWWKEVSKETFASGCRDLAAALKNWKDSKSGKRAGGRMGFPIHKKRHRRLSTTYTTGPMRLDDAHHVTLPKLGKIHLHENCRKLYRRIERGARISRATLTYRRGRWWVCLLVHHLAEPPGQHRNPGTCVGVDVGAKDLLVAATVDGTEVMRIPMPAQLRELEHRKDALQRKNRHRQKPRPGQPPSNRWVRGKNRIAKIDHRIANLRENLLHQVTTTLTRDYETVVVETLNVAGIKAKGGAHKRGLNRAVALAALANVRKLTTYKCLREGGQIVLADRFFPSSKTCSNCATVKAKLRLSERTYVCGDCGYRIDRDLNAAINLARLGPAGSGPVAGRGAERKTGALSGAEAAGCEASTSQRVSASDGDPLLVTAGPGTRSTYPPTGYDGFALN